MKLLLVDDNRDVLNWGCRATSISLSRILRKLTSIEIEETIDKRTVDTKIPIGLSFFERRGIWRFRRLALKLSSRKTFLEFVPRMLNIQNDFVTLDPTRSVANLLRYRRSDARLHSIYEKVRTADLIVINGEGSMIFTTPPRRDMLFQLMIIELAVSYFQKPVFYFNAMISDCPVHGRNQEAAKVVADTLLKCEAVALRDFHSIRICREINDKVNCSFVPDALFSWFGYMQGSQSQLPTDGDFLIPFPERDQFFGRFDFHKPYICVGGSSLAAWKPDYAIGPYCKLVERLKTLGASMYLVETCTGDHFLREVSARTGVPIVPVNVPILMGGAILANSRLFVSGRYHPSILASLGGTPCIFLGSNSHKTRSLQEVLGYDEVKEFSAVPKQEEVDQILIKAKDLLEAGEKLRRRISAVSEQRSKETMQLLSLLQASITHLE